MQSPKKRNKSTGDIGEKAALELLKSKGYKIVTTNYRTKFAELDIIAVDKDTLVFVEVKTRRNTKLGLPEEAVGKNKLHKISLAGQLFLMQNPGLPTKQRIDVVSIILNGETIQSEKLIKVT